MEIVVQVMTIVTVNLCIDIFFCINHFVYKMSEDNDKSIKEVYLSNVIIG